MNRAYLKSADTIFVVIVMYYLILLIINVMKVWLTKRDFIIEKQIVRILCNTVNVYQISRLFYVTQILTLLLIQSFMKEGRNFSQS